MEDLKISNLKTCRLAKGLTREICKCSRTQPITQRLMQMEIKRHTFAMMKSAEKCSSTKVSALIQINF